MAKVTLKIPPFFAYVMNPKAADWFVLDKQIGEKTTVCDLLTELALGNPDFRQAVFNPDEGTVYDGINIVLNQKLLISPLDMHKKLNDGDLIVILPSLAGG
ncbi:MAG: MoaD/ThiS family protein [Dehalococcoidales bacterium]